MSDEGIAATNDDATLCKFNCVQLKYFHDPFITHFIKHSHVVRKPPEINRGYYARLASVWMSVINFIDGCAEANLDYQIINIGCGFDTLYWRLKTESSAVKRRCANFVEVDMPSVTAWKTLSIRKHQELLSHLKDVNYSRNELHSEDYHLVAADLRDVRRKPEKFQQKLFSECGLDPELPTLCIAECVLVYLLKSDSDGILQFLTDNLANVFFINYEQVNMKDRFGEIMLENLHQRNCDLIGAECCDSLETQMQRFLNTGWTAAKSVTLLHLYQNYLPREEIHRIEKIEFLDEKELLEQLLSHYCLTVAWKQTIPATKIDFSCLLFFTGS